MKFIPYEYTTHTIQHIYDHPAAGLLLDMGLGKTAITLTAIDGLIHDFLEVRKVLIIAPKFVAQNTWPAEIAKWDHLRHLTYSLVLGTEKQRKEALRAKTRLFIINPENIPWLIALKGSVFDFDMVVIDEISKFKSAKAIRFKALHMVMPKVKRKVGLTGTPVPNGLIDLWAPMYLLDQGERLGKTLGGYRRDYFVPGAGKGHIVYNYNIKKGAEAEIYRKISDICISMKTEDYIDLPKRINRIIPIKFPPALQKQYDDFEKSMVLSIGDEEEITAANAAVLSNKLLQFANGAVYDENKKYQEVHSLKLEALEEIVDTAQAPVLVFYWFKSDAERIMKALEAYKPEMLKTTKQIDRWNCGEIPVLLAHPMSAGHGLNLQYGGNIEVWYSMTFHLEAYLQASKRLHRPGLTKPVIAHHLIGEKTMDQDAMKALERKHAGQNALLDAVKARIEKYLTYVS